MNIEFYEGPAGVGKTYRLLNDVAEYVRNTELDENERVLALTFMNGARRRLASKLKAVPELRRRSSCVTIDGFAKSLIVRWRSLVHAKALDSVQHDKDEFSAICATASYLLEIDIVRRWVAISYPVVIVDETQDLTTERLAIIQGLSATSKLFAAADEFQCLNSELLPNRAVDWLRNSCTPIFLENNRRTDEKSLLDAANALRSGDEMLNGFSHNDGFRSEYRRGNLQVIEAHGTNKNPGLFAWSIGDVVSKTSGRLVILTPDAKSSFIRAAVNRVREDSFVRNRKAGTTFGPFKIRWEMSQDIEMKELCDRLELPDSLSLEQLSTILIEHSNQAPVNATIKWAFRKASVLGVKEFGKSDVLDQIEISCRNLRRFSSPRRGRVTAMTIHQAKNREFDSVLLLWPNTVAGNSDHRRRLLYNALTRAKKKCTILVHGSNRLEAAPFV